VMDVLTPPSAYIEKVGTFMDALQNSQQAVAKIRIAYSPRLGFGQTIPYDKEVADIVDIAVDMLGRRGFHVTPVSSIPDLIRDGGNTLWEAARTIWFRQHLHNYNEVRWESSLKEKLIDPGYIAIVILPARTITEKQIAEAKVEQERVVGVIQKYFQTQEIDILLTPTIPKTAWHIHNYRPPPQFSPFAENPFTFLFNWTGSAASSVPVGKTKENLPVGLQVVASNSGKAFEQCYRVFQLSHEIECLGLYPSTHRPSYPEIKYPDGRCCVSQL